MTNSKLIFIVALVQVLLTLNMADAQLLQLGGCPAGITTQPDFNLQAYLGRWYEYSKYPFVFEFGGKCIYAEYGLKDDGNVSVFNSQINKITGNTSTIQGTATVVGDAKLSVTFNGLPSLFGGSPYWVLGTDYVNYATVYSCNNIFGILRTEVVWILTRERFPSEAVVNEAKNIITKNGLSLKPLTQTEQQGCPANNP